MTTSNCTASTALAENTPYPSLTPTTLPLRIAEDEGAYTSSDPGLTPTLKRLEVKAQGQVLAGQITRLYGLVSLLLPNEHPTDRSGEELKQLAIDLEQATEIIEAKVNELVELIVNQ